MAIQTFNYEKDSTINMVKTILSDAIKYKATDIHFNPQKENLIIKFRIDGELTEYTTIKEEYKINILTRVKLLANMNITITDFPQKGTIKFEEKKRFFSMQAFSIPTLHGEKITVHLANYNKNLQTLEELGFDKNSLEDIKKLIKENNGVIAISSPLLEGKTTTLYAILKELQVKNKSIITIENPIKLELEGILQTQPMIDKGLTTKILLENISHQDPTVLAISDIDTQQNAQLAFQIANNNTLVLTTLPSSNINNTLTEFLHQNIDNYILSKNLKGIISQRLIKKLCPHCKKARNTTAEEQQLFEKILNKKVETIYEANTCNECINGYKGRTPVLEVCTIDSNLRQLLLNGTEEEIKKLDLTSNSQKKTLEKIVDGITTFEEYFKIFDKTSIKINEENIKTEEKKNSEISNKEEPKIQNNTESPQEIKAEISEQKEQPILEQQKIQKEEKNEPNINQEEQEPQQTEQKKKEEKKKEEQSKTTSQPTIIDHKNTEIKQKPEKTKITIEDDYDNFDYDSSYINSF